MNLCIQVRKCTGVVWYVYEVSASQHTTGGVKSLTNVKCVSRRLLLARTCVKRVHAGEKPYTCDIGLRSFRVLDTRVQYHVHTGEKLYASNICLRSIIHPRNLVSLTRAYSVCIPVLRNVMSALCSAYTCRYCQKVFSRSLARRSDDI
jgi:hypothetical protein